MNVPFAPIQWRRVFFGTGVAAMAMLTLAGFTAWMIGRQWLEPGMMGYGAAVTMVLSAFLGAAAAGAGIHGLCAGVGLIVVLLGLHGAIFGGPVEGFAVSCLPVLGGSGAAALIFRHRGTRSRRRKKSRKIGKMSKNQFSAK